MKTCITNKVWRVFFIFVFTLGTVWTPGISVKAEEPNSSSPGELRNPAIPSSLDSLPPNSRVGNSVSAIPPAEKAMNGCINTGATVSTDRRTRRVDFVGTAVGQPISQTSVLPNAATPEQAARNYLRDCGHWFGLQDQAAQLQVQKTTAVKSKRSTVRFQQVHQDIPIFAGELVMQLDPAKNVLLVNGHISPSMKVNTQPTLLPAEAQVKALEAVASEQGQDVAALTAGEPELWIYDPGLITTEMGPAALVWRMEVSAKELSPIDYLVLVDAHTGSVRLSINQADTAKNCQTYTANNTTTRPGTLVCDESNPDCTGGDADAVNAHAYSGDTYDFYNSYHGRDSIDNAGMTLISTVHYSSGYCNAFWNGTQMTYGDGCSIVVDDVVAHEMTHGVTEYEFGLVYMNQSGAINESFSDIWGEWVDLTNGRGTDTPEVRWYMGEDVSGGAIRNMKDPTEFNNADRMGSPLYYIGVADNGGVHWNSGVGNKAAYLITDGDTFNGYEVTGLGITKAAKIYYEVQTNILTSGSDYGELYNALYQACTNLIGTSGISAADCQEVRDATDATEMNIDPPMPPAPANDDFDTPNIDRHPEL